MTKLTKLRVAGPMLVCDFMIIAPSVWTLFRFHIISLLVRGPGP